MNAPMDEVLHVPEGDIVDGTNAWNPTRYATLAAIRRQWRALPLRDQRAVIACAVVIAATAVWQLGWEPAAAAIPRIQRELPLEREQLLQVQTLGVEATRLRNMPDIARKAPDAMRDSVAKSLETAGLTGPDVKLSGATLQVHADKISFYTWMQWLARTRAEFGLTVVSMEAKKTGTERGEVSVNAELALPSP